VLRNAGGAEGNNYERSHYFSPGVLPDLWGECSLGLSASRVDRASRLKRRPPRVAQRGHDPIQTSGESEPSARMAARSMTLPPEARGRARRVTKARIASSSTSPTYCCAFRVSAASDRNERSPGRGYINAIWPEPPG
jgi:hypothetical protein